MSVLVALLVGVGIGASSTADDEPESAADIAESTTTTRQAAEETTSSTTTTTRPRSTTTVKATTTLPPTTTTTAPPPTPEQLRAADIAAFKSMFEASRSELAQALQSDVAFDSVDLVSFDEAAGVVRISVTTGYATSEYQVDEMWEAYRTMATFWTEDSPWRRPNFTPGLAITNSAQSYDCDAGFMMRLGTFQADQAAWQGTC